MADLRLGCCELRILRGDRLKPVEHVRCDFYRSERMDADFSTTRIHGIDAIRHLAGGTYQEAQFCYQDLQREKPTCNIYMNARFDNGVFGVVSFIPSTGALFERPPGCCQTSECGRSGDRPTP